MSSRPERLSEHAEKTVQNLVSLTKKAAGSGEETAVKDGFYIADRDAQEAYDTLQKMMWFGNYGEPILREIEEGLERIAELSRYDTEKELRQAVEER